MFFAATEPPRGLALRVHQCVLWCTGALVVRGTPVGISDTERAVSGVPSK
jgi:hypothetical protein